MGRIFRNKLEIPIPEEAYIGKTDARVFLMYYDQKTGKRRRLVIGRATSETTMHPNETYRYMYPVQWEQFYGSKSQRSHELHVGLYSLLLSAAWTTKLYPMLQKVAGPLYTNAILDYCMFCIRERTNNATHLMEASLRDQMSFTDKLYSDSWYSEFFENKWSLDSVHDFKIQWLSLCAAANQHEKVWLCIDGSNNDCVVQNSQLAEHGNAKSHKEIPIYGYIWAVSAKDGTPITWFVNNGGKIDSKAFEKIAKFLSKSNISIEGVIVDRGFASERILKLIRECGYDYIVMLKSSSLAFQTMMESHADEIRRQVRYVVNDRGLFGTADHCKVFASGTEEACVALYYDAVRGNKGALKQIAGVLEAYRNLQADIAKGKPQSELIIPTAQKRFLKLAGTEEAPKIEYCYDEWQKEVDDKGYSAIASSRELTAQQISELYDLRDVSEKQFSCFKSQEGCHVTRVHDDPRIEVKLAVCFIACIVRNVVEQACRSLKLDTNRMLQEADRCVLTLMPNDKYLAVHDLSERLKQLFARMGITDEHLDLMAEDMNKRQGSIKSQTREMPPFEPRKKKGPGRPPKEKPAEETQKPKRGRGRPLGSKNKKTLERERLAAEAVARGEKPATTKKRKPGRPLGSKNKKTLERERLAAEAVARGEKSETTGKRKPGRPLGSKNKKTLERERLAKEAATSGEKSTTTEKPEFGHAEKSKNNQITERDNTTEGAIVKEGKTTPIRKKRKLKQAKSRESTPHQ